MIVMTKRIWILLAVTAITTIAPAQPQPGKDNSDPKEMAQKVKAAKKQAKKALSTAEDDIKKSKNLDKHEKTLTALLKDSVNKGNTAIYTTINEAQLKQYAALNQKLYLKQKADTASLFSLSKRMFENLGTLDSIESVPDEKGRVNPKHRKQSMHQLKTHRPNLFTAGIWYLRQKKYKEADSFLGEYIESAQMPMMQEFNYNERDSLLPKAAYWTAYCGYKANEPDITLRYDSIAYRDTATNDYLRQYIAHAYQQKSDTANAVRVLRDGFDHNPTFPFFYPRLIQYYTSQGNLDEAMRITSKALEKDSLNEQFLYTKGALLLALGNNKQSLIVNQYLMNINDSVPEAYYNAATALLNINSDLHKRKKSNKTRQWLRSNYQKAKEYLERYRKLAPDEKKKWAPALYRVYLNLNMGKELSEVEKYLK